MTGDAFALRFEEDVPLETRASKGSRCCVGLWPLEPGMLLPSLQSSAAEARDPGDQAGQSAATGGGSRPSHCSTETRPPGTRAGRCPTFTVCRCMLGGGRETVLPGPPTRMTHRRARSMPHPGRCGQVTGESMSYTYTFSKMDLHCFENKTIF